MIRNFSFLALLVFSGCTPANPVITSSGGGVTSPNSTITSVETSEDEMPYAGEEIQLPKTEEEWRKILTEEQFYVAREKGTERAFSGEYWDCKKEGIYTCVCCGSPLFDSETKYESGTGWPSFWAPVSADKVNELPDNTLFSRRTEVVCARCDAHLGHVFDDGPQPTGLRYCLNSAALKLREPVTDEAKETPPPENQDAAVEHSEETQAPAASTDGEDE